MKKFLVTEKHGRVFRNIDGWRRVLVAIPGQEIDLELARECGLLDEPEPEAEVDPPQPVRESEKDSKQPPVKRPPYQTYPTKKHKAL